MWNRLVEGIRNCAAIRGHSFQTVATVRIGKSAELASAYLQVFST